MLKSRIKNSEGLKSTRKYLKSFYIKDYIFIVLGLISYTLGIRCFLIPHQIVTGGLMGISLLLNYSMNVEIWMSYFGINLILLLLAWRMIGWRFVANSIFSIILLTFFLSITEHLSNAPIINAEPLMSGIIGGALCGIGLGLNISANSSTGGLDFIAAIITKYKRISMGRVLMIADIVIVSSSYFIFGQMEKVIYGLIVITVLYYFVDSVINGRLQSMQYLIFSSKYDEIATHINLEIHRGCTVLDGIGWYTKTPQKVILIIAKRGDSTSIFRLVKKIDEKAFIIQSNVGKVYGEGFDKIR